jgi:hypothetical protein
MKVRNQPKLRTYSRCAMFDWSDTVFRRRNVTRRRISNTVLQPKYWGSEADSPEVCRLHILYHRIMVTRLLIAIIVCKRGDPLTQMVRFKLKNWAHWSYEPWELKTVEIDEMMSRFSRGGHLISHQLWRTFVLSDCLLRFTIVFVSLLVLYPYLTVTRKSLPI